MHGGSWWTTPLTVLTIIASIATICGLYMISKEMRVQKASQERQELIVKDLVRHVLVNAAIMEVIRMKMAGKMGESASNRRRFLKILRVGH